MICTKSAVVARSNRVASPPAAGGWVETCWVGWMAVGGVDGGLGKHSLAAAAVGGVIRLRAG